MKKFSMNDSTPKRPHLRALFFFGATALGLALGTVYYFYDELYRSNVRVPRGGSFVCIPTGSSRGDVLRVLAASGTIDNMASLTRAMDKLEYGRKVYPGRYRIAPGMGNKRLVRTLAAGLQTPVPLTFGSVRTRQRMAGIIARQLEPDSAELLLALRDEALAARYGFSAESFPAMLLPNTYQMYWNTTVGEFFRRMNSEWEKFWGSRQREEKLRRTGLTRVEAVILASIVAEETGKEEEMPAIAGVYLNRLRRRMPLQADPTVRYAVGDFTLRRILTHHTKVPSPYNTYRQRGLPPGPICIPPLQAVDAVLSYQQHDYLFFCAKPDFSGYHVFAKTYAQHAGNAAAYQKALSKRSIYQ